MNVEHSFALQLDAKYALLKPFKYYRFLSVKTTDNRAVVIAEIEIEFADHKCEVVHV